MKRILLALVLGLTLVSSGVTLTSATTEVVVPPGSAPAVQFAGSELTNFLARVFGAPVPLGTTPRDGRISLILGENALARAAGVTVDDKPRDSFVIAAKGNRVFLVGRDDPKFNLPWHVASKRSHGYLFDSERATLFAVYDFLEQSAGCRFYFAHELGTIVPRQEAIVVPDGTREVTPNFLIRDPYFGGDGQWFDLKGDDNWAFKSTEWLRLRFQTTTIPCCHGSQWFDYMGRFGLKDRPDFMAQKKDGTRWTDPKAFAPNQLCWSNPDLHEELYQDIKAYLTGQPASSRGLKNWAVNCRDHKYVDIMPDDSFSPCFCARCQAAYHHDRGRDYATELMWGLVAKLARRLTAEGVKGDICMMAYPPYRRVPDFDLPPNIQVMVATTGPWAMVSEKRMASDQAIIDAWSKKLGHRVWAWTYPHKFGRTMIAGVPSFGAYSWGKYYQRFQYGIFGSFAECECDRAFYNHLNYYVFSRVGWDAKADVNAVIAEYHRLMFGAGAAEMAEFYRLLEKKWLREVTGRVEETSVGPIAKAPSSYQLWHDVYSPEVRATLRKLLADAVTKVGRTSIEAKRMALVKREVYDPLIREAKAFLDNTDIKKGLARRASEPNRSILSEKGWGGAFTRDTKVFVTPPDSICFEGDGVAAVSHYLQGQYGTPALKPNTKYRLSYFVKTENVEPRAMYGGGGGISVNLWDDQNRWFPGSNFFTGTMDWIYQEFEFKTGAHANIPYKGQKNQSYLWLHCLNAKGKAWFDDVRLEEISD